MHFLSHPSDSCVPSRQHWGMAVILDKKYCFCGINKFYNVHFDFRTKRKVGWIQFFFDASGCSGTLSFRTAVLGWNNMDLLRRPIFYISHIHWWYQCELLCPINQENTRALALSESIFWFVARGLYAQECQNRCFNMDSWYKAALLFSD